jgi:hypothetical protein
MRMQSLNRLVLSGTLIAATASCGDVVRQGHAPVFLVIDSLRAANGADPSTFSSFLLSDVQTMITEGGTCTPAAPCPTSFNDPGQVDLRIVPKDVGTITPTPLSTNNEVTITRYRVSYRRADGRNTPGIDIPYGFDGAVTGTVVSGSALTMGFQLVRNVAKKESPLVQLIKNQTIITMIADVTFYGQDRVGNDVSASGSIQIDFANFGD